MTESDKVKLKAAMLKCSVERQFDITNPDQAEANATHLWKACLDTGIDFRHKFSFDYFMKVIRQQKVMAEFHRRFRNFQFS